MNKFKAYINNLHNLTFLTLLIISFLFLFNGLSNQSFWNDELAVWFAANKNNYIDFLQRLKEGEPHPPLYWSFIYFLTKVFPSSEWIMRLPSAVFGFISIIIIYKEAKKLYNKEIALFSCIIFSLNINILFMSQQARSNIFAVMLSLISFSYFYEVFFKQKNNNNIHPYDYNVCKYEIFSLLCMYCHYSGLFQIVAQGIFAFLLLIKNKALLKRFISTYSFIIICYIPQFYVLEYQNRVVHVSYNELNLRIFIDIIKFYFGNGAFIYFLFPLFLYSISNKIICLFRNVKNHKKLTIDRDLMILFFGLFPFFAMIFISLIDRPMIKHRHLMLSSIFIYFIVAETMYNILKNNLKFLSVILIFALSYNILYIEKYYKKSATTNWRDATDFISRNKINYHANTYVICAYVPDFYEYYRKKFNAPNMTLDCYNKIGKEENYEDFLLSEIKKQNKDKEKYGFWVLETEKQLTNKALIKIRKEYNVGKVGKFYNHIGTWYGVTKATYFIKK